MLLGDIDLGNLVLIAQSSLYVQNNSVPGCQGSDSRAGALGTVASQKVA